VANKLKIIVNTHGGKLSGDAKIALVEQGLQAAGIDNYHLEPTQYANHACEIARQAAQEDYAVVVAVGGDGTINEVLNGLMQAAGEQGQPATLGIIPMGTANDLADILQIPNNIPEACRRLAAGNIHTIDIGCVNGHYFANNSAIGLEPVVTITQNNMRWLKGVIRYVVAALKVVYNAKEWNMRVEWDTGMYDGPMVLVSVGNGHRSGGAFYITPLAKVDDGKFDFVYGVGMNRLKMLSLLPKIFTGKHVYSPLVGYLQTTTLLVTTSPETPIQADGEIIDEKATKIHYKILPQKLQVIV